MLNIFICEDDSTHLASIKKHIEGYVTINSLAMKVVCAKTDPTQILNYLEDNPRDAGLYFLDLHLNASINGIDLAEAIRKHDPRGFIVFITSDAKAYMLTFKHKVEALDYIVKGDPYLKERIEECIENAMKKFTSKATELQDNFVFKLSKDIKKFKDNVKLAKDSTISIDSDKIFCLMTEPDLKHTVIVYTIDGRLQFNGSLRQAETDLDKKRFFRCQNNLIVNLDKVEALDPIQCTLTFENNFVVNVAVRKIKKLDERINQHKKAKS